jgi:hypothetical protein
MTQIEAYEEFKYWLNKHEQLLSDRHPGLFTWNQACAETAREALKYFKIYAGEK